MSLRPTKLDDIIGLGKVKERLSIAIESAKQRRDSLAHQLFMGPAGTGKTTLSQVIANELGVDVQIANGPNLRSIKALVPYIMRIEENSVLFIDEIHRLTTMTAEFLYTIMEDFRADLGKDSAMSIDVPRFTLIGATTDPGKLPKPLRDRFQNHYQLALYTDEELAKLIKANAEKLNLSINEDALLMVAEVSRGTPRVANSRLLWVRDVAFIKQWGQISRANVLEALDMEEIDEDGLNKQDRLYLEVLRKSYEPMGIKTLVSSTGIAEDTIQESIEPYLIKKLLIKKTPRGRVAV